MCSGLLFAFSMVLFFFGISVIITYSVWGYNYVSLNSTCHMTVLSASRISVSYSVFLSPQILQCVYGALAALLFSMVSDAVHSTHLQHGA